MTDEDDPRSDRPRREFLNLAIAGTATALGAMSLYPAARFVTTGEPASSKRGEAGAATDFPRGSAKTVLVGERPALVLRLADGSFRAFVALCTHLRCVVRYSPERERFECPCHRGVFSLDGQNVAGPPTRPLEPLAVDVVDGVVTVREG